MVTKRSTYYWSEAERGESINYKELSMVLRVLERYGPDFRNSRLVLWCDNSCTCSIFKRLRSRKIKYSRCVKKIIDKCLEFNILLKLEWVCTSRQLADSPRYVLDPDTRLHHNFQRKF